MQASFSTRQTEVAGGGRRLQIIAVPVSLYGETVPYVCMDVVIRASATSLDRAAILVQSRHYCPLSTHARSVPSLADTRFVTYLLNLLLETSVVCAWLSSRTGLRA